MSSNVLTIFLLVICIGALLTQGAHLPNPPKESLSPEGKVTSKIARAPFKFCNIYVKRHKCFVPHQCCAGQVIYGR